MNRRDTVAALLTLGIAPLASFAQQQGKVWRIGRLTYPRRQDIPDTHFSRAFQRGLRDLGYIEGKNLIIEERFGDNKPALLPGLMAELMQQKVDVIVTGNTPATTAAQKATSTIPIVFLADSDPVGNGLVASLARPGGNITGLSTFALEVSPKHLEMARSIVPKLSRVAALLNPDDGPSQAATLKSIWS